MDLTQDLISLTSALVQINSVNPWLVPGGKGEAALAAFLLPILEAAGAQAHLEEVQPGRPNLIATWKGTGGGPSLGINAHLDTVGDAGWEAEALVPRLEGDRLIGLGAGDDKGHCAAALLACREAARSGRLRGDLMLALTADEEGESTGASALVKTWRPDAVLVLEPFGLDRLVVTHQGFGWLDLVVEGRAAHGSAPEQGLDAIAHMGEVLVRLAALDREQYAAHPHPLNGKTVYHASTIAGGSDYATYPAECRLGIEIGTQPGETIADRVREIEAIFSALQSQLPDFHARVEVRLHRSPFESHGSEALWQAIASPLESALGKPVEPAGLNAWTDAALFQEAGIPTLLLGARGGNFHAPGEWVSIPELAALTDVIMEGIRRFCQ